MKDYVDKLLDDIERILKRDDKSYGDLARELGRGYNQVYDWLKQRRFKPRTTAFLELLRWRDANLSGATVPGRKLTQLRAQQTE